MGIGNDESVGAQFGDLRPDLGELGDGFLAGKPRVVEPHRPQGRWRTVDPNGVERRGSTATSVAPAAMHAFASFSAPSLVCSQGS